MLVPGSRASLWKAVWDKDPQRALRACDEIVHRCDVPDKLTKVLAVTPVIPEEKLGKQTTYSTHAARGARSPRSLPPVTKRQCQLLHCFAHGLTQRAIAVELGIAEQTVRSHAHQLLRRLKAKNMTHAVTIAMRKGLIT